MTTENRYAVRDNGDGTYTVTRNGSDVYTDTSLSFATRVRNAMNASLDERRDDEVTPDDTSDLDAGLAAPAPSAWDAWLPILWFLVACAGLGFLGAVLAVHWFGDLIAKLLGGG